MLLNNDLTGDARKLAQLMSRISEDIYSAGWLTDLEWQLWRALTEWRTFGRADWPHSDWFGEDLAVWMWELDWLQKQSGGWVWWQGGEEFVPEERWLHLVAAREANRFRLDSNTKLDAAVSR